MLFMRICVITYYCKVVVGSGAQLCTLLEVWVLGVGMSTFVAQTALYVEDRGLQVPMTLEHNLLGRLYSLGAWPTISFQVTIKHTTLVKFLDIDSTEEVVILFEVELQKPRNLSVHESEEYEHRETWVCMVLCRSQVQCSHMVSQK